MSVNHNVGGNGAPGRLVLLRHGQTAWSVSGQHTGRTDIPLTEVGERQAKQAGERLRAAFPGGFDSNCVFTSTLSRAGKTAELAGFKDHGVMEQLCEWDYGCAEGRTRETVSRMFGRPWVLWEDGTESLPESMCDERVETLPDGTQVTVVNGRGETLDQVAARTREAIDTVMPLIEAGHDVLFVAHSHVLRILATQWLGVDPHMARLFRLDTACYSVLGQYKGDNVINSWNI